MGSFQNKLKHFLSAVDDVSALQIWLQYIPLQNIKRFIISEIDTFAPAFAKTVYFSALPIDSILPPEIMQHCLSFNREQRSSRLVSKSWNGHFALNEQNYLRNIYEPFSNENEHIHRTIVVHPKRVKLHPVERSMGFFGPMTFPAAMARCRDGDRFLLHSNSGKYNDLGVKLQQTVSDIQVIGVESHVKVYGRDDHRSRGGFSFGKARSICFENIDCIGDFLIKKQKAVFTNCCFLPREQINIKSEERMSGIRALIRSDVVVDKCSFTGFDRAIFVNDEAKKVSIVDSLFCGYKVSPWTDTTSRGIILVYETTHMPEDLSTFSFKFVGNKFVNCIGSPVAALFYDHTDSSEARRNYCLERNVFCTLNDIDGEQHSKAYDANRLYREPHDGASHPDEEVRNWDGEDESDTNTDSESET